MFRLKCEKRIFIFGTQKYKKILIFATNSHHFFAAGVFFSVWAQKSTIFCIFLQKDLHISENCCTFVTEIYIIHSDPTPNGLKMAP